MAENRRRGLIVALMLTLTIAGINARAADTIPPGTVITPQNWQQYKQYMPDGMQALFGGRYYWKMPPDLRIVIGPTSHYPIPAAYLNDTRKYSSQVRIKDLPDGGHYIEGYIAGRPFPDPADPMRGYKILVDMWYRYQPYLLCGDDNCDYLVNGAGNVTMLRNAVVLRRLSHISDANQPINDPHAQGIDYSQWRMVIEPEQEKYTQTLTLYYVDQTRPEDDFLFLPSMRRVIRESSNSRCAPASGTDFVFDDFRGGFNGGIARFQADYLRDQSVLSLVNADPAIYGNTANYYSIMFPKPEVGKWEVRDVRVIDTRRIPSMRSGYCYGKQIMYIDNESYNLIWKDLYDPAMNFAKTDMVNHIAAPVPNQGIQFETANSVQTMWNLQREHLTFFSTAGTSHRGIVSNELCRNLNGVNYDDINHYSTVSGLSQTMR
jgi:hypothetical protein